MTEHCPPVERRQSCIHAEEAAKSAADAAVVRVFAILGVDIAEPKEVKAFQEGLWFGGRFYKATDKAFGYVGFVIVGLIATGLAYAIWDGIIVAITKAR